MKLKERESKTRIFGEYEIFFEHPRILNSINVFLRYKDFLLLGDALNSN